MRNKKGFTLVELIAVIVILAIIIAIAVPTYGKIKTSVDKKNYENSISLAKTAALKYAEDTNIKIVFIQDLIEAGYLDEKQFENLVSPKTGNKISLNCYLLKVTSDKGMIYADFIDKEYKTEDKNQCDYAAKNKMNTDIRIIAKEYENGEPGQELQKSKNYWTNKDVLLTYETSLPVESVEWYRGYEKLEEATGQSIIISGQNLLEQLYTVKIVATKDEVTTKYETSYYVRIDKNAPVIDKGVFTPKIDIWSRTKVYEVTAHDNHSGLWGYTFIDEGNTCTPDLNYQKNNRITFNEIGKKRICVKDYAGNVNTDPHEIEIKNIDNTDMNCEFEITGPELNSYGGSQWYKNVTLKLKAKEVGNSEINLGISETTSPTYPTRVTKTAPYITLSKTADMSGRKFYGYIKNEAGTTGRCYTEKIAVEKSVTAPVKTGETKGYDSITVNYTKGSAESDIAETKCYRTDASGNILATGTLSGNNCVFSVEPTYNATTYYFKKCIQSNARKGLEPMTCSERAEISNIGYCDVGQYTKTLHTTSCDSSYHGCTNVCGGGTEYSTKYFTYKNLSKYNSAQCGNMWVENQANGCNRTCGGKYVSGYGSCNATCPTTSCYAGGTVYGSQARYYASSVNGASCGSDAITCSASCPATSCWTKKASGTAVYMGVGCNDGNRSFAIGYSCIDIATGVNVSSYSKGRYTISYDLGTSKAAPRTKLVIYNSSSSQTVFEDGDSHTNKEFNLSVSGTVNIQLCTLGACPYGCMGCSWVYSKGEVEFQ